MRCCLKISDHTYRSLSDQVGIDSSYTGFAVYVSSTVLGIVQLDTVKRSPKIYTIKNYSRKPNSSLPQYDCLPKTANNFVNNYFEKQELKKRMSPKADVISL